MEAEIQHINKELADLKKTVERIQIYLEDCFLTPEENKIVAQGFEEFKEGKTVSLEKLKKRNA